MTLCANCSICLEKTVDALVLGKMAYGVVMVLMAEQSKNCRTHEEKMEAAGVPILGAILSGYNVTTSAKKMSATICMKARKRLALNKKLSPE